MARVKTSYLGLAIFSFLAATLSLLWLVLARFMGMFKHSRRGSGSAVTIADSPFEFWLTLAGVGAFGLFAAFIGLRLLAVHRRASKRNL